ncbi:hypothetical protein GCM10015536_31900 [Streptomyces griseomycini]|nr:hypothetical protein GCM10015536_31900 [Streptomyces griseomycini]
MRGRDARPSSRPDPGRTTKAPTGVHPPLGSGGRRVTVRGEIVGLANSDRDVVELLRRAGLPEGERLLDDPAG